MITLTAMEIYELASFAGLTIEPPTADERDSEFVVTDCPDEGILNDDGQREKCNYIVYCADYPEEGCIPLGETELVP